MLSRKPICAAWATLLCFVIGCEHRAAALQDAAVNVRRELADVIERLRVVRQARQATATRDSAWRQERAAQRNEFLYRFHELLDYEEEESLPFDPGQLRAVHEKLVARLLERTDQKSTPAVVAEFCAGHFAHCGKSKPDLRGIYRRTHDRGELSVLDVPEVADRYQACADYAAQYVAAVIAEQRDRLPTVEEAEKLEQDLQRLIARAFGASIDQWLAGAEPDRSLESWLRDVVREFHPESTAWAEQWLTEVRAETTQEAQSQIRAVLATYAAAQRIFRDHDADGNGRTDYWTADVAGLYRLQRDGLPIGLIDVRLAALDARPAKLAQPAAPVQSPTASSQPFALFRVSAVPQPPDAASTGDRFAICAYPLVYGRGGRQTYFVDETGKLWSQDIDGAPLERRPDDPAAAGWTESVLDLSDISQTGETAENRRSEKPFYVRLPSDVLLRQAGDVAAPVERRTSAISQLSELIAAPTIAKRLIDLTTDESIDVQAAATAALGRLGDVEADGAVTARAAAALQVRLSSTEADVAAAAAQGLMGLCRNPSFDAEESLQTLDEKLKTGDSTIIPAVLSELPRLGPRAEQFIPTLLDVLKPGGGGSREIVAALQELRVKTPAAVAAVEAYCAGPADLAGDVERNIPSDTERGMQYLADAGEEGIRALARLLAAEHPARRLYAAQALARVGELGRPAVDALTAALRDEDPIVRPYAAAARWKITGEAAPSDEVLAAKVDPDAPTDFDVRYLGPMSGKSKIAADAVRRIADTDRSALGDFAREMLRRYGSGSDASSRQSTSPSQPGAVPSSNLRKAKEVALVIVCLLTAAAGMWIVAYLVLRLYRACRSLGAAGFLVLGLLLGLAVAAAIFWSSPTAPARLQSR